MKKIINNIFLILVILLASISSASAYVRKKVKPNFFVPEADVSQNNKYTMPKFGKASRNAVNRGIHKRAKYMESSKPSQNQVNKPVVKDSFSDNPEYQNKYQEYLKDVDQIKQKGYVRESNSLRNDLSKMSSEERIRIDQEFNKSRNVEGAIDSLIK